MEILIDFVKQCKELMLEYSDDRNIQKSFYMQAFGACNYESIRLIKEGGDYKAAEAVWEKYGPELEKLLNGEG